MSVPIVPMIARHNIIFITGVLIFTASFFIPIDDTEYGYAFALFAFTVKYENFLEAARTAFLVGITNLAAAITLVAYFTFYSRWISLLALVGTLMALYWTQEVVRSKEYFPEASICWALGSLLIGLGYELKRRGIVGSEQ